MVICQRKDSPMSASMTALQFSGPVTDLNVVVRFQRSATAGSGAGDCVEVGAVGGAGKELPQPARMIETATEAASST
jgi:hypothetical protein